MEDASIIEHFCHEHSLRLVSNEGEKIRCYGCRKDVVVSEMAYICCMSDDKCRNKIILHKRCAEMPRQIHHPSHPQHPLSLCINPYGVDSYPLFECNLCERSFVDMLHYHCYHCKFDIDISCKQLGIDYNLSQEERLLRHSCHEHPLMLQRKLASEFFCNGCGTNEGREMAYICITCEFWVHKSCASLHMEKQIYQHHHPLLLAFSFPFKHHKYLFEYKCDICRKHFDPTYWVYYCDYCRFFTHVKCATQENMNILTEKEEDDDSDHVIQLPASDFSKEVITPFIIRQGGSIINVDDMPTSVTMPATNLNFSMLFNYHKHPLSLIKVDDDNNSSKNEMKICDLCITPILSPPYYSCADCNYFVHLTCYLLPKTIRDDDPLCECGPYPCRKHKLTLYAPSEVKRLLRCCICWNYTNGIAYCCQSCYATIDVKCASLPIIIKHASHRNHTLIKKETSQGSRLIRPCVVCDSSVYSRLAYYCSNKVDCEDVMIHAGCVMLPLSIKHRWDKHPLLLTFDASIDHPSDFYCEACEEEMHPKKGMYHCRECDQSFHIHCLTESGHHRNIKFGRQFEFGGHVHPHPLTYNLVSLKHKCDRCDIIEYEKRGFECASNCNYALCEDCGLKYKREPHDCHVL
ncbi:hypothetical protein CDL12_16813 [Handroanthus impetiginosus]|uniref:Zinc finger PHD-type domain-containing protein n=1 Tax=Handroanthus impetiginosus TaxID=429701 RepID=A0A2G9GZA0_9LAMI|nr:hypothetical protein CDL12_16813 [Handroanthus impetiginosus]